MNKLSLSLFILSFCCAIAALDQDWARAESAEHEQTTRSATPPTPDNETEVTEHIDEMIKTKWKELELTPSKNASDSEWLRRIYLDTIGRTPTLEETLTFMRDKSKDKRSTLIDSLLSSKEYATNWAYLWNKELVGASMVKRGSLNLFAWLEDAISENMSYREMTRELLTSTGDVNVTGRSPTPAGYYVTFDNNVNNLASNVSRVFLGIEIQCAQCHDHMYEHWTQADFQGFAALFKGTRAKRVTKDKDSDDYSTWEVVDFGYRILSKKRIKELEKKAKDNPEAQQLLDIAKSQPKVLDGPVFDNVDNGGDAREALVDWMTANDNEFYARTIVNRIWAHYLKRGFVEPVDDFSSINEPSNPELLAYLARDFVTHGYDLRRLTRIILNTRAYQLSSDLSSNNEDDLLWYSRAYVEQLSAVQVFNSLIAATNAEKAADKKGKSKLKKIKFGLLKQFTTIFQDDEGKESESFTGTIPQALLMMNSDFLNKITAATPRSTLGNILKDYKTPEQRIDALYLAALSRTPLSSERDRMFKYIKAEDNAASAYEDVFWALLNSAEFLNNH